MAKFNRKRPKEKPRKPRPDFPLFAHSSGQWAKKIRGRLPPAFHWAPWGFLRREPQRAPRRPGVEAGIEGGRYRGADVLRPAPDVVQFIPKTG